MPFDDSFARELTIEQGQVFWGYIWRNRVPFAEWPALLERFKAERKRATDA